MKSGSRIALVVMLGLVAHARESRADFATCTAPLSACTSTSSSCCTLSVGSASGKNPILIAMDRCHQPIGSSSLSPPGVGAPRREFSITTWSRSGSTVTATLSPTASLPASGEIVKVSGTGAANLNGNQKLVNCSGCTSAQVRFTLDSTTGVGTSGTAGKLLSHNPGNGWCAESPGTATRIGGNSADTGMLRAYGLVYRLMQRGIPVYWLVNPGKSALALNDGQNAAAQTYLASDVDLWVLDSTTSAPPTSAASLTCCGPTCTPSNLCQQPVHRLNQSDLAVKPDSYRYKEFPVRGGAFLIAAADRAKFDAFWMRTGAYASLSATKYNWTTGTDNIDLYEIDSTAKVVYQDYTSGDGTSTSPYATVTGAPLSIKIDYEPARVGCLGCSSNVAQAWLDTAGLRDPASAASCASGEFVPSDATYCLLNDYDVAQGTLVSGGFSWMWMFGYNDNSPCADSSEKAVFDKVRDFMTSVPAIRNAGHGIFLDDSIKVAEGCANKQLLGLKQATSGLDLQNSGAAEPFILRYPSNLFMQFGDMAPAIASGTVSGWKYYKTTSPAVGYQTAFNASGSSLRRLISVDTSGTNNTLCLSHASSVFCDAFTPSAATGDLYDAATYARLADNLNNGLAFYLPGNQLNNSSNYAELRMLLNSLIALPDETFTATPTELEVARSSPIVATVGTDAEVFQGTYTHYDPVPSIPKATTSSGLARFTFPYTTGHFREIPVSSFTACNGASCATSNGNRTAISALSGIVFDAADHIPAPSYGGCATNFNGSCRTVFTTLQAGRLPPKVFFNTANVDATTPTAPTNLGNTIASNFTQSEKQELISRILAGRKDVNNNWVPKLGGIDRSTPAVIEASPIAGSAGRPTMAYFGATDGMLHAVCVTTGGGCDEVGRELWAYIPRTVLPDLRQSTARVDGSPHVIDAYGDFDNNGSNAWHTILIFHTGTGRMTNNNVVPAVYALDITTPNSPSVLWEYSITDVSNRQAYDMGIGLNIVAGAATVSGVSKTVAFMQTNNGGTGGAASVTTAINVETGAEIWQKGDLYPTSSGKSARNSAHEAAPSSGIPGGVTPIDTNGDGKYDKVVYGTLYGDVYVRAAGDGLNQNGATSGVDNPLLRISADYKPIGVPPAVYKKGSTFYAAFGTGGYADSQGTLWRGDNEASLPTQLLFAVNADYTGGTTTESDATNVPIKTNLGTGEGTFAQVMVVGNELFAATDTTNINDYAFGTSSTPTGHIYRYNFGGTTPVAESTLVVASGAGSLFNSGTTLINASGKYGERLTQDAIGTTGTAVDAPTSTTSLKRSLWLRTE